MKKKQFCSKNTENVGGWKIVMLIETGVMSGSPKSKSTESKSLMPKFPKFLNIVIGLTKQVIKLKTEVI